MAIEGVVEPKNAMAGEIKANDARPWERVPTDTDRSFEAFEAYRTMGIGRSLSKAALHISKSIQLLERWSKQHKWYERVQAFDRYEARTVNERVLLGTAEMRQRMVNQALGMQARAQSRILKMSDADIALLRPSEVIQLMRVASDMERKARDIPEAQFMMWDKMPTFEVQIIRPGVARDGSAMVGVQLPDGRYGYIAESRVDQFRADYPEAVVVC